ncbi:hypothetical protein ACO0RG_001584 [Hanseniaspora osmophila]
MNESAIQNNKKKRKSRIQKHEKALLGYLIRPRNTLDADTPVISRNNGDIKEEENGRASCKDFEDHDTGAECNNESPNQGKCLSDDDIAIEEKSSSFSSIKKLNVPLESLRIWDLTPKFHNDIMLKKNKDTLIMANLARIENDEKNEKFEYQLKLVGSGIEMLRPVDLQTDVSHVYYDQSATSVGFLLNENSERELRLSYRNLMYSYRKFIFRVSSSVDEIIFNELISILSHSVDPSHAKKKKFVKKCKDYHGILTLMNHERLNENDQNGTVLLYPRSNGDLSPTSTRREKELATIENGISERSLLSRNTFNFLTKKLNSLENLDKTRSLGSTRYTAVNRTEPQVKRKPSLISSPLVPPSRLPDPVEKESHIVSNRSSDEVKSTEKPLSTLAFYGLGEQSKDGSKPTKRKSTSTEGFNPSIYSDSDEEDENRIDLDGHADRSKKTYVRRSKRHRVSPLDYDEEVHTEPTFDFGGDLKYQFQDSSIMQITNKDFQCLFNSDWVNDSIIDFFLKFFKEREQQKQTGKKVKVSDIIGSGGAKREELEQAEKNVKQEAKENMKEEQDHEKQSFLDKTYIFNTFFFTKLSNCKNSFDNVLKDKWLNKNNCEILTKHDYLIVPINYNYHWFGCIIENYNKLLTEPSVSTPSNRESEHPVHYAGKTKDTENTGTDLQTPLINNTSVDSHDLQVVEDVKNKITIYVFDSLRFSHSLDIKIIKDFLVQFAQKKFNVEIDKKQIRFKNCQVPLQPNMNDCGIHLILNAEKFFEDPEKTIAMWNENSLKHNASLSKDNFLLNAFFQKKQRKLGRKMLRQTLLDLKMSPANLNFKKEKELSDKAQLFDRDSNEGLGDEQRDKDQANSTAEQTHEDDDVEIIELLPHESGPENKDEIKQNLQRDGPTQAQHSTILPEKSHIPGEPPFSDPTSENNILSSQACNNAKSPPPEQNSSPPQSPKNQEPQTHQNVTFSKTCHEANDPGNVQALENINESSPKPEISKADTKRSNDSISTTLNKINAELGETSNNFVQPIQKNGSSNILPADHAEISDSDSNADACSSSSNDSSMNLLHEHSSQPIEKQADLHTEVSPFVGKSKYFKSKFSDDHQSGPEDINAFLESVSIKSSPTKSPHYALSLSSSDKPSLKDRSKLVQRSTPHVPFPRKFSLSDPKLVALNEESLLKESPGSKNLSAYISLPQDKKRPIREAKQSAFFHSKINSDMKDESISLISDEEPEP